MAETLEPRIEALPTALDEVLNYKVPDDLTLLVRLVARIADDHELSQMMRGDLRGRMG